MHKPLCATISIPDRFTNYSCVQVITFMHAVCMDASCSMTFHKHIHARPVNNHTPTSDSVVISLCIHTQNDADR